MFSERGVVSRQSRRRLLQLSSRIASSNQGENVRIGKINGPERQQLPACTASAQSESSAVANNMPQDNRAFDRIT
jgi:hypothetical protein